MNDASPSSSDHAIHDLNDDTTAHAVASAPAAAVAANSNGDSVQRKRHRQRQQRTAFLDHLIRNLDIVFYCQLSILYYMECVCPRLHRCPRDLRVIANVNTVSRFPNSSCVLYHTGSILLQSHLYFRRRRLQIVPTSA